MQYSSMVPGIFLERPNRFVARILINGKEEVCHVKNTGRCRELLIPGARVWCQESQNPKRKTRFDLITVKKGDRLINMDSQAPNAAAGEWLREGGLGPLENLRPEVFWEDSRFDFAFEKDGRTHYLEVKGVTLEEKGLCAFPDAPTTRGTRHLRSLIRAAEAGLGAWVLFVIQMENVRGLCPHETRDPAFAQALRDAQAAGVRLVAMSCAVTESTMTLHAPTPILLNTPFPP